MTEVKTVKYTIIFTIINNTILYWKEEKIIWPNQAEIEGDVHKLIISTANINGTHSKGQILNELIKLKYVFVFVIVYLEKLFSTGSRYKTTEIRSNTYESRKKQEKLHKFENVIKNIILKNIVMIQINNKLMY